MEEPGTMARLADYLRNAQELEDRSEWESCLAVCLEAISITPGETLDDWISLRLTLGSATLSLLTCGRSADVDRALLHVAEILSADLDPSDERVGCAHLQLGCLYDERESGDLRADKSRAIAHWEKASQIFAQAQSEAWAACRECIGVATLEIVNSLMRLQDLTMPGVLGFAEDLVEYAILTFEDARKVYLSDETADRRSNVEGLIADAQQMLQALRD